MILLRFLFLALFAPFAFGAGDSLHRAEASTVIEEYALALRKGDAVKMSTVFHPDFQALLKKSSLDEIAHPSKSVTVRSVLWELGVRSQEEFAGLPLADATARSYQRRLDHLGAQGRRAMASTQVRLVGVLEEEHEIYAVVQLTMAFGNATVERAEVFLLREYRGHLRLAVAPGAIGDPKTPTQFP